MQQKKNETEIALAETHGLRNREVTAHAALAPDENAQQIQL